MIWQGMASMCYNVDDYQERKPIIKPSRNTPSNTGENKNNDHKFNFISFCATTVQDRPVVEKGLFPRAQSERIPDQGLSQFKITN